MLDSVRARLTLWYVLVLALVLIVLGGGVYALLAHTVRDRFDAGLREAVAAMAVELARERQEGESERQAAKSTVEELYFPQQALAIFDARGELIAEKPAPGDLHAAFPPPSVAIDSEVIRFFSLSPGDTRPNAAAQRLTTPPSGTSYVLVAAQSAAGTRTELAMLQRVFLVAVPLTLALAAAGGWFLARKALAPVAAMSERARRITAQNLDERLPVSNPRDELGRLAAVFNDLLTRLSASFQSQRQFMADASHELRTPLSVMRTAAEVTLEKDHRDEDEYRDALAMIGEQSRRLTRLVDDMFTLAQSDAGWRSLQMSDFYLDEVLAEAGRSASVLAARKGVELETNAVAEAPFRGDEGLIRQLFLNLLDNAIKHTPVGGRVGLHLQRHSNDYVIEVSDTGPGIPEEARAHIFERFFRADKARPHSENGNGVGAGLGLSIARWIAEAHDGRLELQRSAETGSTFVITLPATTPR